MSTPRAERGDRLGLPATGAGSLAGYGPRLGAFLIDALLSSLVAGLFTAPQLPRMWSLLAFACEYTFFAATFGQTPGMAAFRLALVRVGQSRAATPVPAAGSAANGSGERGSGHGGAGADGVRAGGSAADGAGDGGAGGDGAVLPAGAGDGDAEAGGGGARRASLGRVALRTVLLILLVPAVIVDSDGRGMHDRASGTAVIKLR